MGPLEGIKVVDLSAVVSGPLTGALLAEQGAAVIKVERPGGDIQRNVGSARNGFSGSFHHLNRGKRSISLDLKHPEAVHIVRTIANEADVLIQNFRPGVVQRLGVDYDTLAESNPGLVYLSISGFGQTGPLSDKRAYDAIIQNYAGIAYSQGMNNGDSPSIVTQLIMDKLTGHMGFQAITAALLARERTGEGQQIELSMLDAALAFTWPDMGADEILLGDEIDHRAPIGSSQGTQVTLSDGYATLMVLSDHEFSGLCQAFGFTSLAEDERFNSLQKRQKNRPFYLAEVSSRLADACRELTLAELEARLAPFEVPWAPSRPLSALPQDEQVIHNGTFFERDHPVAGRMREARPAPIFKGTPIEPAAFAPRIGEHTREVLSEFGFDEHLEAYLEAGAVFE